MTQASPWNSRFCSTLSFEDIYARVGVAPAVLQHLSRLSPTEAEFRLEWALRAVFVPTAQIVAVLHQLHEKARVYSAGAYPSIDAYVQGIYAVESKNSTGTPICITGLAGVGKSAIVKALARLMPPTGSVDVPGHANIVARSLDRFIMAPALTSRAALQRETEHGSVDVPKSDLTARSLYRDGVALICIDEFQGVASASATNTRAAALLLQAARLGPPLVFIANFSLVHKFMNRKNEDQHRLLNRPIVIEVDEPGSLDWVRTLQGFVAVAPEVLKFDPQIDGDEIHHLTAGLKRLVIELIIIAYRMARADGRESVGIADLSDAYRSVDYTIFRTDVEALTTLAVQGKMTGRKDLECPFPNVPRTSNVVVAQEAIDQYKKRIDEEHLRSSLTAQEREGLELLGAGSKATSNVPQSAKVLGMKRKKQTVESLLAAEDAFRKDKDL